MLKVIRDWWRGFRDEDVDSLREKLQADWAAGTIVPLTAREMNALRRYPYIGVQNRQQG